MEHTISTTQVNDPLNGMMQELIAKGDRIVVKQDGEAVAVVVPVGWYEQQMQARQAFFDEWLAMGATSNMDPEEAEQLAAEAIRAVRSANRQ
ncbi:MAG: type II toxin-antitoxin system Phd/YefM family antitoxin [Chloroflexota bacterium]|nr:type II toxin-antitoxin system Phd/YefM family antitoxin [Chloroflexota bacterium]